MIRPDEIRERVRRENLEALDRAEKYVDEQLQALFRLKEVRIKVPLHDLGLVQTLADKYSSHGWRVTVGLGVSVMVVGQEDSYTWMSFGE